MGVTIRVKTMVTPCRSPIRLEVSREGTAAPARGGLVLLFEALAAKRILVGLPRSVGSPAQGWSDAQMILGVLVLDVAGFDRVSDIEPLETDAGPCALLKRFAPKLLGGSGAGASGAFPRRVRCATGSTASTSRACMTWSARRARPSSLGMPNATNCSGK